MIVILGSNRLVKDCDLGNDLDLGNYCDLDNDCDQGWYMDLYNMLIDKT